MVVVLRLIQRKQEILKEEQTNYSLIELQIDCLPPSLSVLYMEQRSFETMHSFKSANLFELPPRDFSKDHDCYWCLNWQQK